MDLELERFKSEINLVEFAASLGFTALDVPKSSKACTILRGDAGKIGISRDTDDHWVFFSFSEEEGGSIIDLVMKNRTCNLGQARTFLRPWIGEKSGNKKNEIRISEQFRNPVRSSADRRKVALEFAKVEPVEKEQIFLESRKIIKATYLNSRFEGSIYQDQFKNAVFPHQDPEGISGLEKRNKKFWSFSEGGKKALWFSRSSRFDKKLVFCESAIDSLSYFQLKDDGISQYFSLGGQMSDEQVELIGVVVKKQPGKEPVLAFDNDENGLKYIDRIQATFPEISFSEDLPVGQGDDWNDCLVSRSKRKNGQ